GPGAEVSAEQLEIGDDEERADEDQVVRAPLPRPCRPPTAQQEQGETTEPDRAEHVGAAGERQTPQRVAGGEDERRRDEHPRVPTYDVGPADGERTEIDQPV